MLKLSSRGFSIIQMVVALGIASILVMVVASSMAAQHREARALNERLGALELQNTLTNVMANGDMCMFLLSPPTGTKPTFNSTLLPAQQPKINFKSIPQVAVANAPNLIKEGEAVTWSTVPLKPKSINLVILNGSGTKFFAQWQVQFDYANGALVRSLPVVSTNVTLTADISAPGNATVTSCQGKGSATAGLTLDYNKCVKRGMSGTGGSYWKSQGLTNLTFTDMEFACPAGTVVAGSDGGTKFSFVVCCPLMAQ
jgi:type II secretory pathway pseudopilin PulG